MCHLTVCLSTLGFPSSFCTFLFLFFFFHFQKVQAVFQSCINTTLSFNPQQEKCAQALLCEAYLYPCNRRHQPCKQKLKRLILVCVDLFQWTGLLTAGMCIGICKIRAWMINTGCSLGVTCVPVLILCAAEFAQGDVILEANSEHCYFCWEKHRTKSCLASGWIRSWVSIATTSVVFMNNY